MAELVIEIRYVVKIELGTEENMVGEQELNPRASMPLKVIRGSNRLRLVDTDRRTYTSAAGK